MVTAVVVIGVLSLSLGGLALAAEKMCGEGVCHGTSGEDLLIGTNGKDRIFGRGGPDTIHLWEGSDYAGGGDGDDLLRGAPGIDRMYGGAGNDDMHGSLDGERDYFYCGDGLADNRSDRRGIVGRRESKLRPSSMIRYHG